MLSQRGGFGGGKKPPPRPTSRGRPRKNESEAGEEADEEESNDDGSQIDPDERLESLEVKLNESVEWQNTKFAELQEQNAAQRDQMEAMSQNMVAILEVLHSRNIPKINQPTLSEAAEAARKEGEKSLLEESNAAAGFSNVGKNGKPNPHSNSLFDQRHHEEARPQYRVTFPAVQEVAGNKVKMPDMGAAAKSDGGWIKVLVDMINYYALGGTCTPLLLSKDLNWMMTVARGMKVTVVANTFADSDFCLKPQCFINSVVAIVATSTEALSPKDLAKEVKLDIGKYIKEGSSARFAVSVLHGTLMSKTEQHIASGALNQMELVKEVIKSQAFWPRWRSRMAAMKIETLDKMFDTLYEYADDFDDCLKKLGDNHVSHSDMLTIVNAQAEAVKSTSGKGDQQNKNNGGDNNNNKQGKICGFCKGNHFALGFDSGQIVVKCTDKKAKPNGELFEKLKAEMLAKVTPKSVDHKKADPKPTTADVVKGLTQKPAAGGGVKNATTYIRGRPETGSDDAGLTGYDSDGEKPPSPYDQDEMPLAIMYPIELKMQDMRNGNLPCGNFHTANCMTLMDTGSGLSLMSKKLFEELGHNDTNLRVYPSDVPTVTWNSKDMTFAPLGMVKIKVKGGQETTEFAYIADCDEYDIVIGRGALSRAGLLGDLVRISELSKKQRQEEQRSISTTVKMLRMVVERERRDEIVDEKIDDKVCPISDETFKKIEECHNLLKGHGGAVATYADLRKKYGKTDNITMEDVVTYIRYCDICQRRNASAGHSPFGMQREFTVGAVPGRDFMVDIFGPHEAAADSKIKYQYACGAIDRVSGMVMYEAILDPSAHSLAHGILKLRAKNPDMERISIGTDRGPAMIADLTKLLMDMLGADHRLGIAYSSQDQSEIERSFRELTRHMMALYRRKPALRDSPELLLPIVESIVNLTPSSVTGLSPVDFNKGILQKAPSIELAKNQENYKLLTELYEAQIDMLEHAQELRRLRWEKRADTHSKPAKKFDVDQFVILTHPKTERPRYAFHATGPFVVVKHDQEGNAVTLRDLVQNKELTVHCERVTPYFTDARFNLSPITAAAMDFDKNMVITEIMDIKLADTYKPAPSKVERRRIGKKHFMVQVKFEGRGKEELSWIKFEKIASLPLVKEYLVNHDKYSYLVGTAIKVEKIRVLLMSLDKLRPKVENMQWDFQLEDPHDGVSAEMLGCMPTQAQMTDKSMWTYIMAAIEVGEDVLPELFRKRLWKLLHDHKECFEPLGKEAVRMKPILIKLRADAKMRIRAYQSKFKKDEEEAIKEIEDFLIDLGILVPYFNHTNDGRRYFSAWRAVREGVDADGKSIIRGTVDLVLVNNQTVDVEATTGVNVDELVREIGQLLIKGIFDFAKWFFQLPLALECQHLFGVMGVTGRELMFTRLPMGAKQSSVYGQEAAELVLKSAAADLKPYQDDCGHGRNTPEEYLKLVEAVLVSARHFNAKFNPKKTKFALSNLKLLGREVGSKTIQIAEEKKMKVETFKTPTIVKEMQQFLGLTNHSGMFVEHYAQAVGDLAKTCPYTENDPKGRKKLVWTNELRQQYELVKHKIACNEGLANIMPGIPFELRCDASNIGIGAVISQTYDGRRHDIAFTSLRFNETQKRWPTIEQEAFAIFHAITHWRDLLIREKFKVYSDHRNLTFVLNAESKKLIRWRLVLQEFVFEIEHIAGEKNVEADYLSRVHH